MCHKNGVPLGLPRHPLPTCCIGWWLPQGRVFALEMAAYVLMETASSLWGGTMFDDLRFSTRSVALLMSGVSVLVTVSPPPTLTSSSAAWWSILSRPQQTAHGTNQQQTQQGASGSELRRSRRKRWATDPYLNGSCIAHAQIAWTVYAWGKWDHAAAAAASRGGGGHSDGGQPDDAATEALLDRRQEGSGREQAEGDMAV